MKKKWLYIFKDPFGSGDFKVGITGNPRMRLGVYQCAYSAKSHRACFDYVWEGPAKQIEKLENILKEKYKWDIESDELGESEWVSGIRLEDILVIVNEEIFGWRFHIVPLAFDFPIRQADCDFTIGKEFWRATQTLDKNTI
jgi:hypothetical protein